jgi:hypothetical protein
MIPKETFGKWVDEAHADNPDAYVDDEPSRGHP